MQQPFSKFRLAQFGSLVVSEVLEVAAWYFGQHLAIDDPTAHGQHRKYQRVLGAKLDTCLWPLGWDAGARRLERKSFIVDAPRCTPTARRAVPPGHIHAFFCVCRR